MMNSSREGKAYTTSTSRISALSHRPESQPEVSPYNTPMKVTITVGTMPTIMLIRAP
jgi:hypothetical protein